MMPIQICRRGLGVSRYRLTSNMTFQNKGTEKVYRLGVTLSGETEGYRAASGFDQQKLNFNPLQGGADTNYRLIISANHLEQETAGYASSYRNRQFAKMNTMIMPSEMQKV